jgi:hypothetical protein
LPVVCNLVEEKKTDANFFSTFSKEKELAPQKNSPVLRGTTVSKNTAFPKSYYRFSKAIASSGTIPKSSL